MSLHRHTNATCNCTCYQSHCMQEESTKITNKCPHYPQQIYRYTIHTHSYNTFVIGTTIKDVTKFNKILTYAKLKHAFEMSQFTRFFNTNVFTHTNFKCMHTYMCTQTYKNIYMHTHLQYMFISERNSNS